MTHLDPEQLAHLAMYPAGPIGVEQQAHLAGCADCLAEVSELREVARLARTAPPGNLPPAPARIWERVLDEIGPRPLPPAKAVRRWVAPAAAAVGLVLGILGTWLVKDTGEPAPIAVTRLEALSGKNGSGSAELLRTAHGSELKVGSTGLRPPNGFYEVWLINADGKRMVSLGILDAAGSGTFGVPADALADGYRIVDVSLEPDDGNPEHSHDSVIRGNLPS